MKKLLSLIICISLIVSLYFPSVSLAGGSWSPTALLTIKENDHSVGHSYEVVDKNGELITTTSRQVYRGDEIILPDGRHYRVTRVNKNQAIAKLLGRDKDYLSWVAYFKETAVPVADIEEFKKRPVGIYHTHTAESYLPTSGQALEAFDGDIYQVGEVFADKLQKHKVNVLYYKTPHDPHNNTAYMRSRRTASGILRNNPIALFDLHRDGVPDPTQYQANVNGEQIAKIRLVVGRQNPKYEANTDFVKRLMAYAEQQYPGIVKDLYMGKGNYNQDLLSTAILLEVGTYTNTLEECQKGIAIFADVVPVVLGLTGVDGKKAEGAAAAPVKGHEQSAWRTALSLISLTALAALAFFLISTGRLEKVVENAASQAQKILNLPTVAAVKERTAKAMHSLNMRVHKFFPKTAGNRGRLIKGLNRFVAATPAAKPLKNKKKKD